MNTAKKKPKTDTTSEQWTKKNGSTVDDEDDEIPSLDESFWSNAQMGSPLKKRLISLRLDNDVVDWFKDQGPCYQTRMNQVLRSYMEYSKKEEVRNK
ncbi:MAG: 3-oxoacyl-ACP synthase [Cyanobacteria bacterium DS3.002]|nr:3-oxoacyl-ACP synthase [Cyanobacteria bacterium DS3.002]